MKIVFFARLFYPHLGGVEKHVLEVSKLLVEKGYKVTVITEDLSTTDIPVYLLTKVKREIYQGIEIYRIPVRENWFKKFRVWFWLFKNRKLIKDANIVHCHDVFYWYLPFKFFFPFKKVFTTFHGYETKFPPSKKAIFVRKISEKLSNGNICVGDFIKKWYGTKATYTTYGGININQRSKIPTLPKLRGAGNDQKYSSKLKILFTGRLEEDMGLPVYLETLKKLKEKNINFEITFMGDGKFKKEAEKFGKVVEQFNDTHHYADYDIAFVSSYLSILEALASKRSVFAVYNNPLKEDYLKMSPFAKFISIVNSSEELLKQVRYFLDNKEGRRAKINNGYNWVKSQNWEKVLEVYLKLWKR